jgi:hypothetical protein
MPVDITKVFSWFPFLLLLPQQQLLVAIARCEAMALALEVRHV